MAASYYLANAICTKVSVGTNFTIPGKFLALYLSVPGRDGSGTEVLTVDSTYVRMPVTTAVVSNGRMSNDADVFFAQPPVSWGVVVGWAIMDALTGGNQLYSGALTTPKTVDAGALVKIQAGDLVIDH
jgi:hypothetical protein